jgi:hypothetical protein
VDLKKVADILD